jgi:hypothetical protein
MRRCSRAASTGSWVATSMVLPWASCSSASVTSSAVARSRWAVGSSTSSRSASGCTTARARASRTASPPDKPVPPSPNAAPAWAWAVAPKAANKSAERTSAAPTPGRPKATLACTVPAKMCGFWPSQAMRWRSAGALASVSNWPAMRMLPACSGASPAISDNSVVLPAPLVAISATCSPAAMSMSSPLKTGASAPGKVNTRPRSCTAGGCGARPVFEAASSRPDVGRPASFKRRWPPAPLRPRRGRARPATPRAAARRTQAPAAG